ncbi:MAG: pyridoxamine 5'-phosphate oxidase family protein, partial [Gemmatimonadales bacterium]
MTDLQASLREFLEQHDTMTLATIGPDREPRAAAVFYAVGEELVLYFLSNPASRHSENLARDSRVAATIQRDGQPWQEIRGLQIEGTAQLVTDEREIGQAARVFAARFAFLQGLL